jgi:hypothetical protein
MMMLESEPFDSPALTRWQIQPGQHQAAACATAAGPFAKRWRRQAI